MNERRLVADIGGTNARLGLSQGGALEAGSIRSFRNDEYTGLEQLVDTYLGETGTLDFDSLVVAIAGPTSGSCGRLTNRNWEFDAKALSIRFTNRPVRLMNDLLALGYSVPCLEPSQVEMIGAGTVQSNGQSLVVGIGTGFNVCPVLRTDAGVVCAQAEYGHGQLPWSVLEKLQARLGKDGTEAFETVEHVFSGRGYQSLKRLFENGTDQGDLTDGFRRFYLDLLAKLVQDLTLSYLPHDGVYFAGGISRTVFCPDGKTEFQAIHRANTSAKFDIHCPLNLIIDDHAALNGCARS